MVKSKLFITGPKLAKIDSEEGLKLTTVNRNNHALMQYAMTNYGTTNLNAEDWKKCEDNFKLNLLYQVGKYTNLYTSSSLRLLRQKCHITLRYAVNRCSMCQNKIFILIHRHSLTKCPFGVLERDGAKR